MPLGRTQGAFVCLAIRTRLRTPPGAPLQPLERAGRASRCTTISADGLSSHHARQERPRRDAQGRGGPHAGGDPRRPGPDRGGRGRLRGHGASTVSPPTFAADGGVARMADPDKIAEIQESVTIPADGEGPYRALRRGADPRGARGRLHRRVGGADACGHAELIDKWQVQPPLRLWMHQPRRGASPHLRGRDRIRTKGEAGTGDIVNAVTRRAPLRRDPAASARCARTSSSPRRRSCARRSHLVKWVADPPFSRDLHRPRHGLPPEPVLCTSSARTALRSVSGIRPRA